MKYLLHCNDHNLNTKIQYIPNKTRFCCQSFLRALPLRANNLASATSGTTSLLPPKYPFPMWSYNCLMIRKEKHQLGEYARWETQKRTRMNMRMMIKKGSVSANLSSSSVRFCGDIRYCVALCCRETTWRRLVNWFYLFLKKKIFLVHLLVVSCRADKDCSLNYCLVFSKWIILFRAHDSACSSLTTKKHGLRAVSRRLRALVVELYVNPLRITSDAFGCLMLQCRSHFML